MKIYIEEKEEEEQYIAHHSHQRLENFVNHFCELFDQINSRGGFEAIDENIKENNELKKIFDSPDYQRAKKANEIIEILLGEHYSPSSLEEIFKKYNKEYESLKSFAQLIWERFGMKITADDLQLRMTKIQEDRISFATKVRKNFVAFGRDNEILDGLIKLKSETVQINTSECNSIIQSLKDSLKAETVKDIPNLLEELKSDYKVSKAKIESLHQEYDDSKKTFS